MGRDSWFDTAQICLNGHEINTSFYSFPQFNKNYCSSCGERTITCCQNCNAEIKGHYSDSLEINYDVPSYCHECGKPYPWTERYLNSVKELIELSSAADEEKQSLINDLYNITVDTPRTQVASTKMRVFLSKAGNEIASAIREIIVDIASETAKKIIMGK